MPHVSKTHSFSMISITMGFGKKAALIVGLVITTLLQKSMTSPVNSIHVYHLTVETRRVTKAMIIRQFRLEISVGLHRI